MAVADMNGHATAQVVADLRFRRRIEALHAMGPRATAELIAEVIAVPLDRLTVDARLNLFLAMSDAALDAIGGRKLPSAPLHQVVPR